ncbi:MAG: zf-TFIIB domain-containing protein [Phycisphaerae bacterium]
MRCPNCKVKTEPVSYEDVRVQMCGQCGGYWVDPLALKRILQSRQQQWPEPVKDRFIEMAEQSNTSRTILCLRCGLQMNKQQFKDWDDIVIDQCPRCQLIWLDPGELEKIQIYWEYAQDHPDADYLDAVEKKAALQIQWQQRQARLRRVAEAAKDFRNAMLFGPRASGAHLLAYLATLKGL